MRAAAAARLARSGARAQSSPAAMSKTGAETRQMSVHAPTFADESCVSQRTAQASDDCDVSEGPRGKTASLSLNTDGRSLRASPQKSLHTRPIDAQRVQYVHALRVQYVTARD
eukprot:1598689-Pleurochrysis_carterae.AAC.2